MAAAAVIKAMQAQPGVVTVTSGAQHQVLFRLHVFCYLTPQGHFQKPSSLPLPVHCVAGGFNDPEGPGNTLNSKTK